MHRCIHLKIHHIYELQPVTFWSHNRPMCWLSAQHVSFLISVWRRVILVNGRLINTKHCLTFCRHESRVGESPCRRNAVSARRLSANRRVGELSWYPNHRSRWIRDSSRFILKNSHKNLLWDIRVKSVISKIQ